jgi:hypothetical protein
MSGRDDSMLDTGMSSAISRRQAARTQEQKKKREERKRLLTPSAEIVLEWIEQEKSDVVNLEKIILNVADEKFLQAQLLARQMHLAFLNNLKNKANNILRELPEDKKKDQPEGFDA